MKRWIIVLISFLVLVLLLILNISFNLFDGWAFFGMIFYTTIFFGFWLFLVYDQTRRADIRERNNVNKQSLNYCWQRINTLLRAMPDGDSVEWASGFGRKSEIKIFNVSGNERVFRSVIAQLVKNKQLVVIIYDVEKDDIVRYSASPPTEFILDPFAKFNPSGRNESVGGGLYGGRYDRRFRNPVGYNSYGEYAPVPRDSNARDEAKFDDFGMSPKEEDARKIIDKID